MDFLKNFLGSGTGSVFTSRTMWFNALSAAAMVFLPALQEAMDPDTYALGVAAINMVLRKVTKEAV